MMTQDYQSPTEYVASIQDSSVQISVTHVRKAVGQNRLQHRIFYRSTG